MKLLRETIRRLILEGDGMKTSADLPEDVVIAIKQQDEYQAHFYYADAETYEELFVGPLYGSVQIYEPKVELTGNCSGAWMVGGSEAKSGWGPLLYDIAIEWATQNAGGLMSDRGTVSASARKVWQYYQDVRANDDVQVHQLDDLRNTLTDEEKDNCDHTPAGGSYYKYVRNETVPTEPKNPDWQNSPLSKRYTKAPTTMDELGDKLVRL